MKRQLNIKLLAWTLGGFFIAVLIVYIVHEIQVSRNARVLLRRADQALAVNDYAKGASYLQRYLAHQPKDDSAFVKYALTLDKLAETDSDAAWRALSALNQALRINPKLEDMRHRAIFRAIQTQRYPEAIKHLQYLLRDSKTPAEYHHKIGWCFEANGDFESAVTAFEAAVKAAPQKIDSYLLLAEIYREHLHQPDKASRVLDELVNANPKTYRAYLARARFHQKAGKFEEADKDLQQALLLAPSKTDVLLAATNLARERGNTKQARKYLQDGIDADPKNATLYSEMAALELRNERREPAIQWLRDGLAKIPHSSELQFQLADLLLDDCQRDAVQQLVTGLEKADVPRYKTDYLQARMLMEEKRWARAADLLDKIQVPKTSKHFQAKIQVLLGWCYGQLAKPDLQLKAFRNAVDIEPNWTSARFGLGHAYLANGNIGEALQQLHPLQKSPALPKEFWKVYGKALVLNNARAVRPRWHEAEHALEQAARLDPKDAEVAIWKAEMLALQKRYDEASQLLQNSLVLQRKDVQLWTASAILAARQRHFEKALGILDEATILLGDQVDLRLAKGRVRLEQGGTNAADELAKLANNADRFSQANQDRLWNGLAHQFYQLGDWRHAMQLWERLAKHNKNDLSSRLYLFELAVRTGSKNARTWLSQIHRIEGDEGTWWRYGEASLLLRDSTEDALRKAKQYVAEIENRNPKWSKLFFLKGQIADRTGNTEQAITNYKNALELGEHRSDMVYRLAYLLSQRQRFFEADRVIALAQRFGPLQKNLAHLGAEIALENRNTSRALNLALQAVSEDSRDYRDLLWLADIQTRAGNVDEAESVYRRLVKHSGNIPDAWTAWVHHLVGRNLRTQAEKVIADMKTTLPADRLPLALGRCYELLGQSSRAEQVFLKLAKDRPNDFVVLSQLANFYRRMDEPDKAEPYLRKMLEPSLGVPGPLLPKIRRRLALIWAKQGNIDRALPLLDINRQSLTNDRARWAILAQRPIDRGAAIEQFEKSIEERPVSNEERMWLATMYEDTEHFEKAQKLIVGMLARDSNNPQLLAWQVRLLLRQQNMSDARTFLDRLAKREPDSVRLRTLRERYHEELKKLEKASGE